MKNKVIKTSLLNKFETFILDDEGKVIEGSPVVLDFNPVIEKIKPKDDNYVILHNKARPINDKTLWRWGVLHKGEYYCVQDVLASDVSFLSVDLYEEKNPDHPPTHVLFFPFAELEMLEEKEGIIKCNIIPSKN